MLPPTTEVAPPLVFMGYVDVGFADAEGDGTSYPLGDTRLPADYGVDTFAPAVNSRGDVASTDAERPVRQRLSAPLGRTSAAGPRSCSTPSTSTLRYLAPQRAHHGVHPAAAPAPLRRRAGATRPWCYVEQAFGRVTPILGKEFFVSAGKFDSVFGIEYLDNQANFRTGITPSLLARYTTGTSLGVKAFFRQQIAPLWSAVSLNIAATNSGNFVEALQPPDVSLTGRAGGLGPAGLRAEPAHGAGEAGRQRPDRARATTSAIPDAQQQMWGVDARLYAVRRSR